MPSTVSGSTKILSQSSRELERAKAEKKLRLANLRKQQIQKDAEIKRRQLALDIEAETFKAENEVAQAQIEYDSVSISSKSRTSSVIGSTFLGFEVAPEIEEKIIESSPATAEELKFTSQDDQDILLPFPISTKSGELLDYDVDCEKSILKIIKESPPKEDRIDRCLLDPGVPFTSIEKHSPSKQKLVSSFMHEYPSNACTNQHVTPPKPPKFGIEVQQSKAPRNEFLGEPAGHEVKVESPDVKTSHETQFGMPDHTFHAMAQLTQALHGGMLNVANIIKQSLMFPHIKMSVFKGEILKYPEFVREFNTYIGSSQLDVAQKLNCLISNCEGQAKEAILSCGSLPADRGYDLARKILHRNYGQRHLIIDAHMQLLTEGPSIKAHDVEAWDELVTQARSCLITFKEYNARSNLDDLSTMRKIVKRFPSQLLWRFANLANEKYTIGDLVNFDTLLTFMETISNVNRSGFGKLALETQKGKRHVDISSQRRRRNVSSFLISEDVSFKSSTADSKLSNATSRNILRECVVCKLSHQLWRCEEFKKKMVKERLDIVTKNKLCFNCLLPDHFVSQCKSSHHCKVPGCNKRHNTLLHAGKKPEQVTSNGGTKSEEVEAMSANEAGVNSTLSCKNEVKPVTFIRRKVVPVRVWGNDTHTYYDTYGFIDDGSNVSIIKTELMKKLGLQGKEDSLVIKTLGGKIEHKSSPEVTLNIQGCNEERVIKMHGVRVLDDLPSDLECNIPTQDIVTKYGHLRNLNFPVAQNPKVEILIGVDVPEAHACYGMKRGKRSEPFAVHTGLGWALFGHDDKYYQGNEKHLDWMHLDNEVLHSQMEKAFENEFKDTYVSGIDTVPSIEDKQALKIMEESICKVNGRYQVKIPWRSPYIELPDNRNVAEKRFENLKRRCMKDAVYHEKYKAKMNEYITKGYASEIKKDQLKRTKITWYIPHHGVGEKFRIVFDASAKCGNTSLNDNILSGPTQTSSLFGVLSRCREEEILIIGDISAMYHQVRVPPEDRDALRFLWWRDGDFNKEVLEYSWNVHPFGGTWAPSVCYYALRKLIFDNPDCADKETLDAINKSFYVDDLLRSEPTVEKAIHRVKDLSAILDDSGFRLTKFLSSHNEVLNAIPEVERSAVTFKLDLDDSISQKALGLLWDVSSDAFRFEVNIEQKPYTRRGLLAMQAQVFDPLVILGPFLLPMRRLLQQLCREDLTWDSKLPDGAIKLWENWMNQLPELRKVSVPRWFGGSKYNDCKMQLHTFCDASEVGLGVVSFVRVEDVDGNIHCEFIAGKSRVAPLKSLSVPRLELSAAVIAVKLSAMIQNELNYKFEKVAFWSDSTSVLQYINNVKTRFKVFVGNRLSVIHENSTPKQWRYVGTKENPADLALRGVMPQKLSKCEMWFKGPGFLRKTEEYWPERPKVLPVPDDDCEIKKTHQIFTTTAELTNVKPGLVKLLERYSSWKKVQISFAWIGRFKKLFMWKYGRKGKPVFCNQKITVEEIHNATHDIVCLVQSEVFSGDVLELRKNSPLRALTPCIIDDLICVGGRLHRSHLSENSKHQIILPYKHHITDLIINHFHMMEGHSGTLHVLSVIRQKFWIIKGHSAVKRVLRKCMKCKKMRSKTGSQIMAPLPELRVQPGNPPFSVTGVDLMGYFLIKSGRSEVKRWAVVFSCMASRAIHIEVVNSLDTSAFINALERFITRRGKISELVSDNASNFTSTNKELKEGLQRWNQSVHESLCQKGIKWKFNPPAASHWGGCWERMIRSIRKILTALAGERRLDDTDFYTFLTKVERILNNRPITLVGDDPKDLCALTPGMLLTGRIDSDYPPDVFMKADGYRKSWKLVQLLANEFWSRWTKEYLQILQSKQKWHQPVKNFAVGDLVLVVHEDTPRGSWPMAIIEETFPDQYGVVRRVRVRTAKSSYVRDIRKLCHLEAA